MGSAALVVRRWRATVNADMDKMYYYNKLTKEMSQLRQSQRRSGWRSRAPRGHDWRRQGHAADVLSLVSLVLRRAVRAMPAL